jgi:hypothetical protein
LRPDERRTGIKKIETERKILEVAQNAKIKVWKSFENAVKSGKPIFVNGELNLDNEWVKECILALLQYEKCYQIYNASRWEALLAKKELRILAPGTSYYTEKELSLAIDAGIVWIGITKNVLSQPGLTEKEAKEIDFKLKEIHGMLLMASDLKNRGKLLECEKTLIEASKKKEEFQTYAEKTIEKTVLREKVKKGDIIAALRLYGPYIDRVVEAAPIALGAAAIIVPDPRIKGPLAAASFVSIQIGCVWFAARSIAEEQYAGALLYCIPFIPLRVVPRTIMRYISIPACVLQIGGFYVASVDAIQRIVKMIEGKEHVDPSLLGSFLYLFMTPKLAKLQIERYAKNYKKLGEFLEKTYKVKIQIPPKEVEIGFLSLPQAFKFYLEAAEKGAVPPVLEKIISRFPIPKKPAAAILQTLLVGGFAAEEDLLKILQSLGMQANIVISPAGLTSTFLAPYIILHEMIHNVQSPLLLKGYSKLYPFVEGCTDLLASKFIGTLPVGYPKFAKEAGKLLKNAAKEVWYVNFVNPTTPNEMKEYARCLREIANVIEKNRIGLGDPKDFRDLANSISIRSLK